MMLASNKWAADFKSISQSYQQAVSLYDTEELIGVIIGKIAEKRITSVIFVSLESFSLDTLIKRITSFFSPGIDALGLARLPTSPQAEFPFEANISLKFSADELKNVSKSGRKIAAANPSVVDRPLLATYDVQKMVHLRVLTKANLAADELRNCRAVEELVTLWPSYSGKDDVETLLSEAKKDVNFIPRVLLDSRTSDNGDAENLIHVEVEAALAVDINFDNAAFKKVWSSFLDRIVAQTQHILASVKNVDRINIRSFLSPWCTEHVHVAIPITIDDTAVESDWRLGVHKILNFPLTVPVFHASQSIVCVENDSAPRLINPHEYIKFTPTNGGVCAIVRGAYAYHHYRQDDFDDSGWGCAYRSFQTVWSWLRYRNFTAKPIPTHREIQQCLVDIQDKKPNFVGSREWIGSLELSYCLETMLGITSRILPAKSGGESIAEHARAIIFHFENCGAPIMIGGGQYAYTILGIDYDQRLGKCQYLVLDPHYAGEENLSKIISGGWCAWKPASFWDKKCFYNLLLPINPAQA